MIYGIYDVWLILYIVSCRSKGVEVEDRGFERSLVGLSLVPYPTPFRFTFSTSIIHFRYLLSMYFHDSDR